MLFNALLMTGCGEKKLGVDISENILPYSNENPYLSPNEYSTISGCAPFIGDNNASLKILFVNLDHVNYFDEVINDAIYNQLKEISPFKENFNSLALYSIDLENETYMGCGIRGGNGLSGSGFGCNDEKIYLKIKEKCQVDDFRGIITVVFVETDGGGGEGGDIIYIGVRSTNSVNELIPIPKNAVIHEIGHNFGLADLYYGTFYFSGQPSQFWPTGFSRAFLNVDGPGCGKWCGSYKPVSEYSQSFSSQCLKFSDKQTCISFSRTQDKSCNYSTHFTPDCCVWSDEKFEYFNTNCVPAFGSENIGIDCLNGTGCYYGAVYGNYAWRPVLNPVESIMFSQPSATKFDPVSLRELNKVFECCLSSNSLNSDCASFRKEYSDFLQKYNFKKRIGSCGHKVNT